MGQKRARQTFNSAQVIYPTQPERPSARNPICEAHCDSDEMYAAPWQDLLEPTTEKLGRMKRVTSSHESLETFGCFRGAKRLQWFSDVTQVRLRNGTRGEERVRRDCKITT